MAASPRFADHQAHLASLRAAALRAVDPAAAVRRHLAPADLAGAERVFVVGAGKAGVAMAEAAASVAGDRLAAGVVVVPHVPPRAPERITFVVGGHPTPTRGSLEAGQAMVDLLARTTARDVVVALISGGGSALLELPQAGLSLDDLQATTTALLKSGAAIQAVNLVRTRLSRLKGGGLARLAHPARVLGLILSDVVGNPLDLIASGPTTPSRATTREALQVIERYGLATLLPRAVMDHLSREERGEAGDDQMDVNVENRLIASNRLAGEAAVAAARELGFQAELLADDWQGEAREMGQIFAARVSGAAAAVTACCLVAGGESTVTVRGPGKGGRNQEVALAAALRIAGQPRLVISTFATDGVDGPTDAAGAVATGDTLARAHALGLDPGRHLADNDAYTFFHALGDLVHTGPTGTNVNDLLFALVYLRD